MFQLRPEPTPARSLSPCSTSPRAAWKICRPARSPSSPKPAI